jgi:PAS domain S-box-containing protein
MTGATTSTGVEPEAPESGPRVRGPLLCALSRRAVAVLRLRTLLALLLIQLAGLAVMSLADMELARPVLLASVIGVGALNVGVLAAVLRPVGRLAVIAGRLARGEEIVVPYTDRRGAAGALARALDSWREAEASRRAIVHYSPIGMLTTGVDGRPRETNPALQRMLGYSHEELADRTFEAFTHPDDVAATRGLYRRLDSGESDHLALDKRYIRRDGSVFWGHLTLTAIRDPGGHIALLAAMVEDVTRRRNEQERAAAMQRLMLPGAAPVLDGYELAGTCRPAADAGGDFLDWQLPAPGTLTLTLGDVMGKGMAAAILMSAVRTALRAAAPLPSAAATVQSVVSLIYADLERAEAFATLFHARLELASGTLRYVDAGHRLAFVRHADGAVTPFGRGGLPLAVLPDQRFAESELALAAGDALVVFSDGVLDLHPEIALVEEAGDLLAGAASAQDVVDRLATPGPGAARLHDDVTVLALWRAPRALQV